MQQEDRLSLDELAARSGEELESLRRWQALGLLVPAEDGQYVERDIDRVRLLQIIARHGIAAEDIARAESRRPFIAGEVERLFPGTGRRHTLAEFCEREGLDVAKMRRLWQAGDLPDEERLSDEDVDALRLIKQALDAGFPEEALTQVLRVWSDSLYKVAEIGMRAFHFYVHQPLQTDEGTSSEAWAQVDQMTGFINELIEPALLYFYRRATAAAARDDMVMHVAAEAGLLPPSEEPGRMTRAIVFTDLASFTPMTDAMGDAEAAAVIDRFTQLVRRLTAANDGRVVKQIGDGLMLVFPDAASALTCALDIERQTALEPSFPAARSGVHWGDVLYREGDYVGSMVNLASRVAAEAQRHQVLLTGAVRRAVGRRDDVQFTRLGKRALRGLPDDVEIFEARLPGAQGGDKTVDPVCRMELGAQEVAARLTFEGEELTFCSDTCLRRYVAAPASYRH